MSTQTYAGTPVQTNTEGFMIDANQWSPAVAEAIASEIGLTLTPRHWEVVNFAREDYATTGSSPGLRRITKYAGVPTKELYKLFPKGPGKLIARIAGLPKPKSCL
jgi:tRNA 2-thiouridine synthesizing protein E